MYFDHGSFFVLEPVSYQLLFHSHMELQNHFLESPARAQPLSCLESFFLGQIVGFLLMYFSFLVDITEAIEPRCPGEQISSASATIGTSVALCGTTIGDYSGICRIACLDTKRQEDKSQVGGEDS